MRSRAPAGILTLTFAFLLIGLLVHRWEIISLVIPLLFFFYFGIWLHRKPIINLKTDRVLETENAFVGDELRVVLHIENLGERIDFAEVTDSLPDGVQLVSGSNVCPISLSTKSSCIIEYKVRFVRRGRYVWKDIRLEWNDPGQMNFIEEILENRGEVQVLPRMQNLKKCDLRPHRVRTHLGNIPSPTMLGSGFEFYGIREYAEGDELRRINWRASARTERLLTNEYETERSGDVVIVVDGRGTTMDRSISEKLMDGCVEVAASVSIHLLKQRNRVGMIVLGEVIDVVKLAPGHRQFLRINDALLTAKVGENRSLQGLKLMLERYFPPTAMLLIVSPLEGARVLDAVETLLVKQHEMIIISPSPVALQAATAPKSSHFDLALRVKQAQRHDIMARLGRYCRVIDWEIGTPLSPHLLEVRGSQPRLRI
jgi:uncharacterized protein (DUF58 family)